MWRVVLYRIHRVVTCHAVSYRTVSYWIMSYRVVPCRVALDWLGSVRLGSARLGSAWRGSARFGFGFHRMNKVCTGWLACSKHGFCAMCSSLVMFEAWFVNVFFGNCLSNSSTILSIFLYSILDINECYTRGLASEHSHYNHNCHSDANCTNIKGSFYCTCHTGHSGDGVTCVGNGNPTYPFFILKLSQIKKDCSLAVSKHLAILYLEMQTVSF